MKSQPKRLVQLYPLLEDYIESRKNANTRKSYRTHFNKLQKFLEENQINFNEKFLKSLRKNLNSIENVGLNNPYGFIKKFYQYLQKEYTQLSPNVKDAHWYTIVSFFYDKMIMVNTPYLKRYMSAIKEDPILTDSQDTVSKDFVINFINNCTEPRLRLWVLFLSFSGWRSDEPLRLRWCDILEPTEDNPQPRAHLKRSKTNRERIRYISWEVYDQLQIYKKDKFAKKHTTILQDNGKRKRHFGNRLRFDPYQLIFSTEGDIYRTKEEIEGSKDKDKKGIEYKANNIYRDLWKKFDKVRKKLGIEEIDQDNKRNTFTPNSFRHYVRTYVNRITKNSDFTEYYVGHFVSTYDGERKTKGYSTLEDFKTCEKYFIHLNHILSDNRIKEDYKKVESLQDQLEQSNQIITKLAFNSWLREYKDELANKLIIDEHDVKNVITVKEQIDKFKQYFYDNYGKQPELQNLNIKEIILNRKLTTSLGI